MKTKEEIYLNNELNILRKRRELMVNKVAMIEAKILRKQKRLSLLSESSKEDKPLE
jgi:hypothetical protein